MPEKAGFYYEKQLWDNGFEYIAGVDEVGRGAWAGPVVAAAVVFPRFFIPKFDLFDSKVINQVKREFIAKEVKKVADIGIGVIDVPVINRLGIGKASQMAFRSAVKTLSKKPDFLLIDAFYIDNLPKSNQLPLKNGDSISGSIAAASIIAKVFRDNLMQSLDRQFPGYKFGKNKGYGTKEHQQVLKSLSLSKLHRLSFNLSAFL